MPDASNSNLTVRSQMTEWLILERLKGNDLPLPKYETVNSAGVDFPACLTRLQRLVPEGAIFKETVPFIKLKNGSIIYNHDLTNENIDQYDLAKEVTIRPRETVMVSLGYKCEFGQAYVLMLHIRSSIGMMGLELANSTGIIDPDYRGELWAVLHNRNNNQSITIKHGDRLIQGVMLGFNQAIIEEGIVCNTARGKGGFGSTGIRSNIKSNKQTIMK